MNKIKTVIVDDELEAREGVAKLLASDQQIDIVTVCANGIEAIQAIREFHPELLFLDIQMPQVNGFEVLNSISEQYLPAVIFTTAYDEYTLRAFEVHAIDYLLKPFTDERFKSALHHAKLRIAQKKSVTSSVPNLIQSQLRTGQANQLISADSSASERLTVKVDGKVHFIPFGEIIWIEAYDYYVKIHVKEQYYLLRDSLKKMDAQLPSPPFYRVHKSSIINQSYLQKIEPQRNGNEYQLTLTNELQISSSRSYREQVKELMAG